MMSDSGMRALTGRALSGNWSKLIISCLCMSFCSSLVFSFLSVFLGMFYATASFFSALLVFPAVFAVQIFSFVLTYGFTVLLSRFLKQQAPQFVCAGEPYPVPRIGCLFDGFRDFRRIGAACSWLVLRLFLWSMIFLIPFAAVFTAFGASVSADTAYTVSLLLMFCAAAALYVVLWLRYGCMFYFLQENPSMDGRSAIRMSVSVMKKNRMRFVKLFFSSCWKSLVPLAVFLVIGLLYGTDGFFLTVCSIGLSASAILFVIQAGMAFTVFFYNLTGEHLPELPDAGSGA